jgi:hypothetical protein
VTLAAELEEWAPRPMSELVVAVREDALASWARAAPGMSGSSHAAPTAADEARWLIPEARETLRAAGVHTIRRAVPTAITGETHAFDARGERVRIADLSGLYYLNCESPQAASAAVSILGRSGAFEALSVCLASRIGSVPNDPYFESNGDFGWPDPQWHLRNSGARARSLPGGGVVTSVAGADLHLTEGAGWPCTTCAPVILGFVDVGLEDAHPDLDLVPLDDLDRLALHRHPDDPDYCGHHADAMAGIAAARTNNRLGIAGVCASCRVLDLESCPRASQDHFVRNRCT